MKELPKIVVIIGPTATGKSDLAVALARRHNGEIISADSRQVYRGLDLGSGKITKREMQGVRHHLIDVASPSRSFSVAQFKRHGEHAIRSILKRGKLPIIVGGTGFYVDALVYNITFPDVKPDRALRTTLEKLDTESLAKRLNELDPERARDIDQHNRVRLIRAIEIATVYGKVAPLTTATMYDPIWIGLTAPRDILRERITLRLDKRMKFGMLKEFSTLHEHGLTYKRMEALGLEYRYGARLLQGLIDRKQFVELLTNEIAKYAKRQMTWFKRNTKINWIDVSSTNDTDQQADEILNQHLR